MNVAFHFELAVVVLIWWGTANLVFYTASVAIMFLRDFHVIDAIQGMRRTISVSEVGKT